jgi:ABC-type transport system involved in multi-copper enzyme maturation permease subunit
MSTIIKLVKIELYKIVHSKLIYYVIAGIFIFLTIINVQLKFAENRNRATNLEFNQQMVQEYKDHLQQAERRIQELTAKKVLTPLDKSELDNMKQRLSDLQTQGEPILRTKTNLFQALNTLFISEFGVCFILPIVTLLVIGTNLSHELSNKTIKLLLAQSIRRSYIFYSKWITCVIVIVFFLGVVSLIGMLEGGLLFGWEGLTDRAVSIIGVNSAEGITALQYVGQGLLYDVYSMTLICTFAMALSTFFPSPIQVTGITMIVNFIGFALNDFLHSKYFSFLFPFSHLNYTYHFSLRVQYTIGQSLLVITVYLLMFLLIGIQKFRKMDLYL